MIREIQKKDIPECRAVIQNSFATVAKDVNITEQNAPRYVAFAMTEQRMLEQYNEGRKMFAYFDGDKIIGFCHIVFWKKDVATLNDLSVLPEYRHRGIAKELVYHSFEYAKQNGATKMNISIVEENTRLKEWYKGFGFKHTHTEKYDFFPFTCGYMTKEFTNNE